MKMNKLFEQKMNRRSFLGTAAGAGAGLAASSALSPLSPLAKLVGAEEGPTFAEGSFNWLTWSDHYLPEQLEEAASKYNVKANPSLFSDNPEAFLKTQQVGGSQLDLVSADAYWVPEYYEEGLIEPFDMWSLDSARGLFDMALDVPFWKTQDGMNLAYPLGWSPYPIAYNPKYVTPEPDSWDVLWDPKYKGKIALEMQPFAIMANMGKSLGFDDPFAMSDEELEAAKQHLIDLLPNVLKFVEQNIEQIRLLADETIWLCPQLLGVEERVKDAGGPEIRTFIPKEGVLGFMDGEMIVKDAVNRDVALNYLDKMQTGEWLAKNFLEYGRPTFSREAYHWLVKNGYEDQAKRRFFDQPELALSITLKGPPSDLSKVTNAFNEALATAG